MAKKRGRKKKKGVLLRAMLVTLLLIAAIGAVIFGVMQLFNSKAAVVDEEEVEEEPATVVTVDNYDVSLYTRNSLKKTLSEKYPWGLEIEYEGETIDTENMLESEIDEALSAAYGYNPDESYTIGFDEAHAQEAAEKIAAQILEKYPEPETDPNVMVYDAETNSFTFHDAKASKAVDAEALKNTIKETLLAGDYTAVIQCPSKSEASNITADDFKLIGKYVTHTTANKDRNTNVSLACQNISGSVFQPGEQFSYNGILGKRTEEKGYKPAGAYSNGEHVLELGGGVCQVSSTIYNAVIAANLQVDMRTGHTYEPTYVTPGEDATVSYDMPDFRFTNSTEGPIGIIISFVDRTVTVEIYGIPQLEEGVTRYLRSEKVAVVDPPLPNYIEDPMLVPGFEVIDKNAKNGSKWQTYTVLEKDGEVINEEYLHTTSYKGEPATIRRNTLNGALIPQAADAGQTQEAPVQETPAQEAPAQEEYVPAEGEAP